MYDMLACSTKYIRINQYVGQTQYAFAISNALMIEPEIGRSAIFVIYFRFFFFEVSAGDFSKCAEYVPVSLCSLRNHHCLSKQHLINFIICFVQQYVMSPQKHFPLPTMQLMHSNDSHKIYSEFWLNDTHDFIEQYF